MKIPITRKGEYDIWSMRIRQYICHTDHNLWDGIVNGDLEEEYAPTTGENYAPPAPKTAKQLAARRNQERVKSILLLSIPDKYLLKFHNVDDAKSLWEAIKSRFGGSNSASQNLAFLSSKNTSSTNEVSTASGDFGVSTASGINQVPSTPCAHDIDYSFLVAMLTVRVKKKGHFARECRSGRSQGRRSYGDNGRNNVPTNESSSQALVAQDGLGGYDWSNDFEVEPVNYALMAISSSSSSSSSDSEVQKCSKCLESFKCLQKNYDTEREKHNKAKLEIRGYEIALESLESRIIGHEKNELAWGEKYEFQNYELKCKEIKINNLNLELEKAVKERDELKDKIAKWEESTKNLEEILKSQMSARDKTGLGYSTQLNELSSNHETDSENSLSIFDGRSSDDEHIPENDRFSKNGYKVVPPPITGNFLTLRADISFVGLDEYAIRNKIIESQTTELNNKTDETAGKTNDANTEKPKSVSESVVSNPKINRDSVIIEDWTSDDEEEVSGVEISNGQSIYTNWLVSTASPNISTARPGYACRPIYPIMDNVRPRGSCSLIKRSYYSKPAFRPKDLKQDVKTFGVKNMTIAGTRAVVNTGKGKLDTDFKKSKWVWKPKGNYVDHVSKDSGSFMLKKVEYVTQKGNPEILLQDHAVVDSGCSSHMTGNKAYLSDYEDFNG
ncbi:hypothetical protein Tco_0368500 [Tanacetum coccineum]